MNAKQIAEELATFYTTLIDYGVPNTVAESLTETMLYRLTDEAEDAIELPVLRTVEGVIPWTQSGRHG